jgi:uncharacterized protein YjbI with pentapeptide repeats
LEPIAFDQSTTEQNDMARQTAPAKHFEDETYDDLHFREYPFVIGTYEYCTFKNSDFSGADLSHTLFVECVFLNCNLSLAKLENTVFRDSKFRDCKMLGLRFDTCNEFGLSFSFENCTLNHSSFYKTKIKKTTFKNTQLQEVDFTGCDATGSVFDNCNFAGATFENTILEKADLRTACNYSIDPEVNRIKKARFSLSQVSGLLEKYDIEIDNAT